MNTHSRFVSFAAVIMAATIVCSCGSKEVTNAKVKPEKVEIGGDLANYLQVVDNEYEIAENPATMGISSILSIKVKAIKAMPEYEMVDKEPVLSASLLGDNGMPVSGVGDFSTGLTGDGAKLMTLLKKGSGEEIIRLETMNGYDAKQHADLVKRFTLSSMIAAKEAPTASSSSSSSSSSTIPASEVNTSSDNASTAEDNSSSYDFDEYLDDYEEYVDNYIKVMKKVKNNDMSVMSEYTDMLAKAQEMQEKLNGMKDDMKPSHLARLNRINEKMMKAAAEM